MKKISFLLQVLLFVIISGKLIFPQTNDPIKNYDGIPILPYLERIDTANNIWYSNNLIDSIETAGVPMVQINDITPDLYSERFDGHNNLKILPAQEGWNADVDYNGIQHYTRACYTVWEAEGTPPEDGDATLYFDISKGLIEDGAVRTKDSIGVRNDTLIYGPYYDQNVFYIAQIDSGKIILYTADFKIKKFTIDTEDPPHDNDTICVLQVTTSHVDPTSINTTNWRFDSTQVIEQTVLKYSDLSTTFQNVSLSYDFLNADTIFTSDTSQFRAGCHYIQFKVIWKGNSNKVRLYVDKITVMKEDVN